MDYSPHHYQSLDLRTLRLANKLRNREYTENNTIHIPLTFRATELAGEVGEACNIVKKLAREAMGMRGTRSSKAHLAEELADVLICLDLLAMDLDIDLAQATVDKFNRVSEERGLKTHIEVER